MCRAVLLQVEAEEVPDVAERMDVVAVPFFTFHKVLQFCHRRGVSCVSDLLMIAAIYHIEHREQPCTCWPARRAIGMCAALTRWHHLQREMDGGTFSVGPGENLHCS